MNLAPPPPPPFWQLPAGSQLVAGMGYSTVLADCDFETYSEAGFVWDATAQKWGALEGTIKKGLPVVGAARYAEHPSTEVLSFYYDLKDGVGRRCWLPGMPNPEPLFAHLARGGQVEAWNSGFEYWIWNRVCVRRYGWPALEIGALRCAMAKSRAHSLPGALGKAGQVLALQCQKDADGDRLLKKFSVPRNPTAKDKRTRITLAEDPVDGPKLISYNADDILAEAEASSRIPDLEGEELEFWLLDQEINRRGVQMDVDGIHNCIAIVKQAHEQYNAELATLTGGTVAKASELQKLQGWLGAHGVRLASLDEEHLTEALAADDKACAAFGSPGAAAPMRDDCRRALEIRALVGSAAVKKVFAMANQVTAAGRLHDLFTYYGARTGRTTGNGPQPTNLPNSGPAVIQCGACGEYHGVAHVAACPWCRVPYPPIARKPSEWGPGAAASALRVIATRDLRTVEYYFGDAMAAVSGCLRGLFITAPGHDLICSDYSSIEAVVLAMIAGEQWRIDVFRTHGKIYEAGAAAVTGVPFVDFMRHAGYTDAELAAPDWYLRKPAAPGSHHPLRKTIGKVSELACFSPDTLVLTQRGYVPIMAVLSTDKLWDGIEWVSHAGVISKGLRPVLSLDGVRMTPNHPISCGPSWLAASTVASNASTLSRCLANGSVNLPSIASRSATAAAWPSFGSGAAAAPSRTRSTLPTSVRALLRGATSAPNWLLLAALKSIGPMRVSSPTSSIGGACLIGSRPLSGAAITPKTPGTKITGGAALKCGRLGARIRKSFCATLSRCQAGTTLTSKWTGSMSTAATSPATCGSLLASATWPTSEASPKCNGESLTSSPVYDIVNAGPRHRFTIKTNSGHLIVHNSGYQGWIGSWVAFGADEFMTEAEMKTAILAWRAASPAIVEFWGGQERGRWRNATPELYGVEGMFVAAVLNPGREYEFRGFRFIMRGDCLYLRLLSGRYLSYHRPRLQPSDRGGLSISYEGWNTNPKNGTPGWIRMPTWGGRLTENIVQATARDIQWHGMLGLRRAGYPVVLHVYDEDIAEVPEGFGSVGEFEAIMSTMPAWAEGWPIKAQGGWRAKRYSK